jgi:hypothetical protein
MGVAPCRSIWLEIALVVTNVRTTFSSNGMGSSTQFGVAMLPQDTQHPRRKHVTSLWHVVAFLSGPSFLSLVVVSNNNTTTIFYHYLTIHMDGRIDR